MNEACRGGGWVKGEGGGGGGSRIWQKSDYIISNAPNVIHKLLSK